jgi:glutathione S-transferase
MEKLTLIIGNKNYSSWSLRPWIFMKTAGIEFEEKPVALFTDNTEEELKPYYSNYKVPILLDGELIVWDSLSILEYLTEKFPDSKGLPLDINARALARSLCAEMHSSFPDLRTDMPMNCRKKFKNFDISQETQTDINRIKQLWRYCRRNYHENGEWLLGEYSIADAMFAPIALRFDGYGVPLDGVEADYVNTVLTHPEMLNWINAGKAEKEIIEFDEVEAEFVYR